MGLLLLGLSGGPLRASCGCWEGDPRGLRLILGDLGMILQWAMELLRAEQA